MVDVCDAEQWDEGADVRLAMVDEFEWSSDETVVLYGEVVGYMHSLLNSIEPVVRWEKRGI